MLMYVHRSEVTSQFLAKSCQQMCRSVCRCIYSGSWDYSVRVWHRSSLDLAGIVPFDDWVFGLASRGEHLLAGVTSRLHVLDTTTLKPLKTLHHQVGNHFALQQLCASSLVTTLKPFKPPCHQAGFGRSVSELLLCFPADESRHY